MRIACPSCGASYELPETLFLTGARKVRCVKCAHQWMAGTPEPATAPPPADPPVPQAAEARAAPAPDPETEVAPRRPLPLRRRAPAEPAGAAAQLPVPLAPPPSPRVGAGITAAWVASLLLLAGGIWAGWTFRAEVQAAWPASAHLYRALGE